MAENIKQDIELGLAEKGKHGILELRTASVGRGIRSSVTVFWSDGEFRTTALFSDYHKSLATTDKRATQKAINTQHALVFTQAEITVQVAAAKEHYAKKGEQNA